jgi:hypothetical protein
MIASVDAALADLYPTRTWGEPNELAGIGAAVELGDVHALADELGSELAAATFVREGDDSEPCDFIYVLCLGRTPCIVQVRDHGVPLPAEWSERVDELYLRVVVSQRARVAAVQQVAIDASQVGGTWCVRESARAGVYDAPLLRRMQRLVAILPAYDLLHVDFGEIAHAPPGYRAGTWRELYGGDPAIANYLFFPQPATMVATTLLEPS